jgi:hypothetical protein
LDHPWHRSSRSYVLAGWPQKAVASYVAAPLAKQVQPRTSN